jgi:hypothetical protein
MGGRPGAAPIPRPFGRSAVDHVPRERPKVIVVQRHDHGCVITLLLLIIAWPLAIVYWLFRMVLWLISTVLDWLTLGPLRRRL